jgi:hypothetical protein
MIPGAIMIDLGLDIGSAFGRDGVRSDSLAAAPVLIPIGLIYNFLSL